MDTSERKTFKLMKLVSFATICIILTALYFIAQLQDKNSTTSFVAGTKILLINKPQVKNINTFSWRSEAFIQNFSNQKINYINYWAQWCEPCLSEIPHLRELADANPNINLIFVNVDSKKSLKKAKAWWQKNSLGLNTFYAKNENNILKHTRGLPYHQIYDQNKNLVSHFTGNIEGKEFELIPILKKIEK